MSVNDIENQTTTDQTKLQKVKEKFYESNAGDGTTTYDQYLHGAPLYLCLLSCFATLFLIGLDQTIVITILETVGNKFHAYEKIGWVSSGYMLTMCVFAATWGRIAITWGRKYSLMTALVLFEAGSLMCALAPNMNVLIGGRILAGIGGGGIQTLTFIVATEVAPIHQRSTIFSILGLAFAISTIAGPLIGGAFTQHSTWRWCFYINLPIGGVAGALLFWFFNPPKAKGTWKEKLKALDYVGTFLMTAGIVIFLLALTFGGVEYSWNSGAVIAMFIIGGILMILFLVWNFKFSKAPIIPWFVIKNPYVTIPIFALFLNFYCFMGIATFISTYFQVVRGYDAFDTGVHLLPMIIPTIIFVIGTGILIKTTRIIKPYAIVGGIFGCVGVGCLTLLKADASNGKMIGLLILPGAYVGIGMQTCMMSSQLNAPKEAGGTILTSSLMNFSRAFGGALGADLSQAIFNASFKNKIRKQIMKGAIKGIDSSQAAKIISSPALIKNLPFDSQEIVFNTITDSLKNVFITATAVACVGFIFIIFFSNNKVPKADDVAKTREEKEAEGEEPEQNNVAGSIEKITTNESASNNQS
ncbi:putative membrane protein [Wickerhamomyces ciferrii]|uniref:Membrane protein n=1 Tax=Wickerhamomyces ciferrii (strain ATCC 14091 / BCRC 22168 / CBS 111 / JCM 3599 / NBRC 0793 / NRRL Y-1031 F-60-10) TaxID=1206466 RepID=K0KE27_WICCF|nr:uncharacterized protein BN7_713 [Wickerhamomyces ciferrii]CCH41176.1 putative membrane protein [Wickerhamomyces ciferrii]